MKVLTYGIIALTLTASLAFAENIVVPNNQAPQTIAAASKSELLDINTATEAELKALPGLRDAHVKRIITNRPYSDKSQIKAKAKIRYYTYRKIEGLVTVKSSK